jgi:hypothetical protein
MDYFVKFIFSLGLRENINFDILLHKIEYVSFYYYKTTKIKQK